MLLENERNILEKQRKGDEFRRVRAVQDKTFYFFFIFFFMKVMSLFYKDPLRNSKIYLAELPCYKTKI